MDLKMKRRKEKIDNERKREGGREEEREKRGGGGKWESNIKEWRRDDCIQLVFTKIIIPTMIDWDS